MGLYKTTPPLSGRMGALWSLSSISESAVIEFGCMGHMAYGRTFLHRMGALGGKLYSTHIGETDIAMGDTSRLSKAVKQVSVSEGVKTIFLLPSSVPEIIGTDLEAVALELSPQFPDTEIIPMPAGGFDACGHKGIEQVLLQLAKSFSKAGEKTKELTFNMIGSCADLFNFMPDVAEIERLVTGAFCAKRLCTMTSDTSVSELKNMGKAHFNLVIRREGEAAAKYLLKHFGTPYLTARPYGIEGTVDWLSQISESFELRINKEFMQREKERASAQIAPIQIVLTRFLRAHKEASELILAGHADVVSGIAAYGKEAFGFDETLCYSDCSCMSKDQIACLTDAFKPERIQNRKGFLMGSAELLRLSDRGAHLQIANPDSLWHHAYEPPLVGFRGAVRLATAWANEMMERD